jgi:hypothetical protein
MVNPAGRPCSPITLSLIKILAVSTVEPTVGKGKRKEGTLCHMEDPSDFFVEQNMFLEGSLRTMSSGMGSG